jgi:glycine/D-amino acid oxidase-like deaminating enzyme
MARTATVIVGAGIVGCLIARELTARDPDAAVTVLDRDAIASGASRRSAGLHLPKGATARTRRMSAYSHAYFGELRRSRPGTPIYPIGATVISGAPGDPSGRGYLGPATAAPAPYAGGYPIAVPEGHRAWQIAGCHYADVYQLAQALAVELRTRVRFGEGVTVSRLDDGAGAVTIHTGTGESIAADRVVLAPGPWLSAPAWRDRLAPLGLRVKKVVALHIARRPEPGDAAVVLEPEDAFLLPLHHRGHWLFSYTSQEWDVDPDALTGELSAADLAAARQCLYRYSPALADAGDAGRVFCDAYSPGREPVVRALDATGRVVFAGAAGGSGYRLGPAIAAETADLLHPGTGCAPPAGPPSEGVISDHQYV